jgi:Tfp pilus assembly protein PilF
VRQRNFTAAREHLQRAIKSDPQSYLAHYYYAYALSREAMDRGQTVAGYPAEAAAQMRTALMKAIEIAPDFPESYRLLAFVHLATNTKLEEADALLGRALALSPGRHEFSFVLAQVQFRRKEYAAARTTLDQVIEGSPNPLLRAQAKEMLEIITITENYRPKP